MVNIDKQSDRDATLALTAKSGAFPYLFPFLQKGVIMEVEVGSTIKQFLEEQIGLPSAYVEKRIQTIFLDAKPVDDLDKAVIKDGVTLTLSAAMPGLLGAMLRKQSACAVLRCQITHTEEEDAQSSGRGYIVLRLFNFMGSEVGPKILEQGVGVMGDDLQALLGQQDAPMWREIETLDLNGERLDGKALGNDVLKGRQVFLQVRQV